jgi:hypothetical protein
VAASVADIFYDLYLASNHKIVNSSRSLRKKAQILNFLYSLANFENNCLFLLNDFYLLILLNKISHRFKATTKLFNGPMILI